MIDASYDNIDLKYFASSQDDLSTSIVFNQEEVSFEVNDEIEVAQVTSSNPTAFNFGYYLLLLI